jgi:hypothetical protein
MQPNHHYRAYDMLEKVMLGVLATSLIRALWRTDERSSQDTGRYPTMPLCALSRTLGRPCTWL